MNLENWLDNTKALEKATVAEQTVTMPIDALGYSDEEIQRSIYEYATFGEIPIIGNITLMDLGGGFGDLYLYLKEEYKTLNVNYLNIDNHLPFINISKDKNVPSINQNFLDFFNEDNVKDLYDYGFAILSLSKAYENSNINIFIKNVLPHFDKCILIVNEIDIVLDFMKIDIDNYDLSLEKIAVKYNEQQIYKLKFTRND